MICQVARSSGLCACSAKGGNVLQAGFRRIALTLLLLVPATTWAAKLTCLTGTDPRVANDAAQIAALRQKIETRCICAEFDGSPGRTHHSYVQCVNSLIKTLTLFEGTLVRPQCKSTVKKYYTSSICGVPASMGVAPCVKTGITGKVTCAIKRRAGCSGVACAAFATCIDAADTNGDGLIGSGDSGACAALCGGGTSGGPCSVWHPNSYCAPEAHGERCGLVHHLGSGNLCVDFSSCSSSFDYCGSDADCSSGAVCVGGLPGIEEDCRSACCAPSPLSAYSCLTSGAPACGGDCPSGQVCGQVSGGTTCECVRSDQTCAISGAPTCDGTCPGAFVCAERPGGGSCACACAQPLCPVVAIWGGAGSADGQFNSPEGVAVDASGSVFVADTRNNRIQKFTNTGAFLMQWGGHGTGDGQFDAAAGVAVDRSGSVFVADQSNHRIQKFTNAGAFLTQWGGHGTGDGQFDQPVGIAIDGSGNVLVADSANSRIQKFTNAGVFLAKWGKAGDGDGEFHGVWGIGVDETGNAFVVDYGNSRIQKFDNNGIFLTKWGSSGSGDGQFRQPIGLAVDRSGNVFVTDTSNVRVEKFTNEGTFVGTVSCRGDVDGAFSGPWGIAIDPSSGHLFVTDGARIQGFACP